MRLALFLSLFLAALAVVTWWPAPRSLGTLPAPQQGGVVTFLRLDDSLLNSRGWPPFGLEYPPVVQAQEAVRPGLSLNIRLDGVNFRTRVSGATLREGLAQAGIFLRPGDLVSPAPDTPLQAEMYVYVQQAKPITVYADGGIISAYTLQPTVGKALQSLGLTLRETDIVRPGLDTPIRGSTTVRVVRVDEEALVEEEVVDYPVLLKPSAELEIDHQEVVQQGREGLRKRVIKVRYEDGQEVERWVAAEWIDKAPVPKITLYGTKIVWREMDTPEGPIKYWRKLRMLATAYDADGGDKHRDHPAYGITYTGMELRRGVVAVDPTVIPLYTRLYVPGYGLAVAGDTGGAIRGNRIDLGFELGGAARRWGVGWVDVYVLD